MGNKLKTFTNKRKRKNIENMEKARAKRLRKEKNSMENVEIQHHKKSPSKDSSETMTPFDLTIETEIPLNTIKELEGRRIIDIQYFFNQIKSLNNHNRAMGCTIENLQFTKEHKNGLHSKYFMKCNMCNMGFELFSSHKSTDNMDVNQGAVTGAIMTGIGRSNLNELLASIDLPVLNQRLYIKCHDDIADWLKTAAETSMQDAAKEEAAEAVACGNVKDGIPVLTVTADCCWSKRSYKSNYSAMSGVAAIIGNKTGKVLYTKVKNKYCVTCAKAPNKSGKPSHNCFKNHLGSSTSMEQSAIVEGFRTSVARQNVIYGTLIADGDASTYKKILESRPYSNYQVEKIECSNHLLRNYCGKILNITKDTSIPISERRLFTPDRQNRFRTAIKTAVRYRNAQNLPLEDRIIQLKKDILNCPKHIFGDHSDCETYYCSSVRKTEENLVPLVRTIFNKILGHTALLAFHSKSLLYNVTNNRAEQFNSVVAKLVGGKRVNYSLKNSYEARCHAAVVSFNSAQPQYAIYKAKFSRSPGISLKNIENSRLQRKQKRKTYHRLKRRLNFHQQKIDYGEECQRPDLSAKDYEIAKNIFLQNLKEQVNNRENIERDTVLQAESVLWLELRRSLLTASSFGNVCKRRPNTSSAPLVKKHLYSYSLNHIKSIHHGKINEVVAIKQLESQENITIHKCGLFIDEDYFFLGASPDGTCDEGIVEIKCPISAYGMSPDEAIKKNKIKFWNTGGNINRRNEWFFQVQGQLHVTKRNLCLLAVWTGKEFPLKIERITRDDDFWKTEMETKLLDYYNKCLIPEIVDSRKSRSMPLRSTTY